MLIYSLVAVYLIGAITSKPTVFLSYLINRIRDLSNEYHSRHVIPIHTSECLHDDCVTLNPSGDGEWLDLELSVQEREDVNVERCN